MTRIKEKISFSDVSLKLIENTKSHEDFSHIFGNDKLLEPVRKEIRDYYRIQQNYKCAYCQEMLSVNSADNAHVEHIVHKSGYIQFLFEPENLCVICSDCNTNKRNREVLAENPIKIKRKVKYPNDSRHFRIYHPHYDEYEDHIIKVGYLYIEKTKKGGYTIYVCNLNRLLHIFGISDQLLSDMKTIREREKFHGY